MTRYWLIILMLSTVLLAACAIEPETEAVVDHAGMATVATTVTTPGHTHPMAPLEDMPEMVRAADARTQEAYRFAAANPDAAREAPCYCGCVGLGHLTSFDCYVAGAAADGALEYDMHAANCTVCVDITQDQMRLLDKGESPAAIRAFLADNYAKYGPPTDGIANQESY